MEILSVKDLNISIDGITKIANGCFTVNQGDVVLLTGSNGCGKSTIIKVLVGGTFDYSDLSVGNSSALFLEKHDILSSDEENEYFRRNICYVSQEDEFESDDVLDCYMNSIEGTVKDDPLKYVFDFIVKYNIPKCFGIKPNGSLNLQTRRITKKLGLSSTSINDEERMAIQYLSMRISKMSGGQKKLANIFTNLIRYEYCDLIILDEPLNNLDYNNVRMFSNILTSIYKDKPSLAILMVTHCRSIPIINKVLEIDADNHTISKSAAYHCSSCFGKISADGLYV